MQAAVGDAHVAAGRKSVGDARAAAGQWLASKEMFSSVGDARVEGVPYPQWNPKPSPAAGSVDQTVQRERVARAAKASYSRATAGSSESYEKALDAVARLESADPDRAAAMRATLARTRAAELSAAAKGKPPKPPAVQVPPPKPPVQPALERVAAAATATGATQSPKRERPQPAQIAKLRAANSPADSAPSSPSESGWKWPKLFIDVNGGGSRRSQSSAPPVKAGSARPAPLRAGGMPTTAAASPSGYVEHRAGGSGAPAVAALTVQTSDASDQAPPSSPRTAASAAAAVLDSMGSALESFAAKTEQAAERIGASPRASPFPYNDTPALPRSLFDSAATGETPPSTPLRRAVATPLTTAKEAPVPMGFILLGLILTGGAAHTARRAGGLCRRSYLEYVRMMGGPPEGLLCSEDCSSVADDLTYWRTMERRVSRSADGVCDDGGDGSEWSTCAYGSDCEDCGWRWEKDAAGASAAREAARGAAIDAWHAPLTRPLAPLAAVGLAVPSPYEYHEYPFGGFG
ncbi:hypothetical protein EMIHUDRAFT_211581 [Emiliania huxleyi CCMP1516]|uniref:Uncharacterized protein n=2 Tax=Emiliania huxleyi TaxID=2903 RepID=A0A0D3IVW0_EMIH1|nr:hypothetical protein EMIHUDRAFT_211581 [Emiliania huxleyi CCMP1516]EOD15395.1 hypothetical protein EMIHUDRAFT_211581 [Emiliania huxleyi CCMP1516]|eukprot:XP_005767824.1 hypothetical protein EMIHUDRAFT_211581 [Emiliania huxleyi CCMP1516]